MYAQVFVLPGAGHSERLHQSINRELLPALRSAEGFSGALSLVHRERAEMLLVVFWETENEAASPPHPSLTALLDELGTAGTTSGMPRLWEVGARV